MRGLASLLLAALALATGVTAQAYPSCPGLEVKTSGASHTRKVRQGMNVPVSIAITYTNKGANPYTRLGLRVSLGNYTTAGSKLSPQSRTVGQNIYWPDIDVKRSRKFRLKASVCSAAPVGMYDLLTVKVYNLNATSGVTCMTGPSKTTVWEGTYTG